MYNNNEGRDVPIYATNAGWIGSTFEEIRELYHGNIKSEMNSLFTTRHEENKLKTKQEAIDKRIKKIKEDA